MNNTNQNISFENGLCNANDSVLCLIDIQDRLVGSMPAKVKLKLIQNSLELISAAGKSNIPVVASEQSPQILGGFLPDIVRELREDTFCLDKSSFSCCGSEDFLAFIKSTERKQFILCGVEVHISILQTAIQLKKLGYEVFIVEDNVGARRLDNFVNGVNRMSRSGISITNVESVISEWERD